MYAIHVRGSVQYGFLTPRNTVNPFLSNAAVYPDERTAELAARRVIDANLEASARDLAARFGLSRRRADLLAKLAAPWLAVRLIDLAAQGSCEGAFAEQAAA